MHTDQCAFADHGRPALSLPAARVRFTRLDSGWILHASKVFAIPTEPHLTRRSRPLCTHRCRCYSYVRVVVVQDAGKQHVRPFERERPGWDTTPTAASSASLVPRMHCARDRAPAGHWPMLSLVILTFALSPVRVAAASALLCSRHRGGRGYLRLHLHDTFIRRGTLLYLLKLLRMCVCSPGPQWRPLRTSGR